MNDKLWAGRFSHSTDAAVNDYNSSISFDYRLFREDIRGSRAHAAMLARQGLIEADDAAAIDQGLAEIAADLESGKLQFDPAAEDIHMFVEAELTKRIGEAGKRLHTGRSRNDQVALDLRLYLRSEGRLLRTGFLRLHQALLDIAANHLETLMPGYTHLQRAQPITLAHYLSAYLQMLQRDVSRLDDCLERMDEMPLGSGALAGTTYPLDREYVAKALGFSHITSNSLDGVADRDFAIEFLSCLAIFMMHVSRLCEEVILWSSQEFNFIELDDAFSTGSSIMPQKKNPDVAELTRGKTGRVYGDLISLLVVMKGLPLAYNKDMQEDKEAVFDAIDTVNLCLPALTGMLKTMKVNREAMREAAAGGYTNATDLADYLVGKGMPFRDAHEVSGKLVRHALKTGRALEELTLDEMAGFSGLITADVYSAIDLATCVRRRYLPGGPAPDTVAAALEESRDWADKALSF